MINITLIGPNGDEVIASFANNDPKQCVALEGSTIHDLNKLMDAGYLAHSEEQDWLDTGKWPETPDN